MTNICTPSMTAAGARVLHDWRKSVNMDLSWPKKIAAKVYLVMEGERLRGEELARLEASDRRAAANTPWNTPPREARPSDLGPRPRYSSDVL